MNICSLLSKWNTTSAELVDEGFDIIGFSETWLHGAIENNLINHECHSLIRLDRKSKVQGKRKRDEGICAYVKKGHTISYNVDSNFNRSDENIELMYFRVSATNRKNIDVFLV